MRRTSASRLAHGEDVGQLFLIDLAEEIALVLVSVQSGEQLMVAIGVVARRQYVRL